MTARILDAPGRVFRCESNSVCVVQLDGYPGMIRVSSLRTPTPVCGVNFMAPQPVVVTVGQYDLVKKFFWGEVKFGTGEVMADVVAMDSVPTFKSTGRRLKPMVFNI
jgi:hypothetical protein